VTFIWLKERQEDKVLLSSIFKASSDRGFERGRKKIGTGEDFEDSG
jgi:hypothetical protein